jgi:pimeloyl-ACP methyl ester carboxylesterase
VVRFVVLLLAFLISFAAVVSFMTWSQDDFIFPVHAVGPPPPLATGAERLQVTTSDGQTLHGVHIPPSPGPAVPKLLVLGFGGNAWNGEDVAAFLHEIYPEAHVVAFHYRGYRPSTGRPSAEALIADAPLVFDAAVEKVRPKRTVVVGFSIGTGVAAVLSATRDVEGLILVTPFDSLKKVAGSMYPWLPVGLFFHHEIDAAGALEGSQVPVAIIDAESDEIIPRSRTDGLRKIVPNLVFDRTITRAGHNDIYARSDFQKAMDEALAKLLGLPE